MMKKAKIIKNGNVNLEPIKLDKFTNKYPVYDKMQAVFTEHFKKIQTEKDRLLFERVCQRVVTDEPINLTDEAKRRFPRIVCERHQDQSEHWYWNDGTENGLHLISFYWARPEENRLNDTAITIGFTYR
jgi:hypothetical protein